MLRDGILEMPNSRFIPFDSVYFLIFESWKEELRANYWHFATPWAKHLIILLVSDLENTSRWFIWFCRLLASAAAEVILSAFEQQGSELFSTFSHGFSASRGSIVSWPTILPSASPEQVKCVRYTAVPGLSVCVLGKDS